MISGLSSIYGVVYLWLINYYYYYVTSCNQVRTMCSDFCIFHSPLSLSVHIDYCKNSKLNKILQSKEDPVQNTLHGPLNQIQREENTFSNYNTSLKTPHDLRCQAKK